VLHRHVDGHEVGHGTKEESLAPAAIEKLLAVALKYGLPPRTTAEQSAPQFTKKPAATRAGDKVTIDFAVNRATDVAVFIENAKGEVVRHLVAGVLLVVFLAFVMLEWVGRKWAGLP
jgi:hypothetical protein